MIYVIVFSITLLLLKIIGISRINSYNLCFLSVIPIILLAGLRESNIGTDTSIYVDSMFYHSINATSFSQLLSCYGLEELYTLLNYIVTFFTKDFNIYLIVAHTIMYGTVLYALFKCRTIFPMWIGMFIYLFVFFGESLNIHRQEFALCFDILSFVFLLENKWMKSIFIAIMAIGFHHSAFIYLIVICFYYLIGRYERFFYSRISKIMIVFAIFILLMTFAVAANFLESIGLIEHKYVERYTNDEAYGSNIPISLFVLTFSNLFVFYYGKIKRRFRNKFQDKQLVLFEIILLMSFMFCFAGLISTFTVRVGLYFNYLTVVIMPILYYKYNVKKWLRIGHLLFFCMYWYLTVVVANLGKTYPYESIILQYI